MISLEYLLAMQIAFKKNIRSQLKVFFCIYIDGVAYTSMYMEQHYHQSSIAYGFTYLQLAFTTETVAERKHEAFK